MKYRNCFLYVLTGIIASTTKTNAQDNHSILGLSDSNYLRGSGLTLAKESGKREESIELNKKRALEVATTKLFSAFSKALGDDCYGDDPTSPPTSTPPPQPDDIIYICKDEGTLLSNTHMKENGQMQSEDPIGCFEDHSSIDSKTFSDMNNIVQDCSQYCSTDFFGLVGATCKCFSDTPPNRLSISSCCNIQYDGVRMDVYFKSIIEDGCNQDITRNLRDQLVQENNADLGYDIVRNTYLSSPFEFYNKGCGTNIYDLKTDVSGNDGSMTTVSNVLSEYAMEKRSHVSDSIGVSASLEYKGLFKKASIQASASFDSEMNSAFQSSGASEIGSKHFSSFGVQRLSEIDLVNFDNKKYFATFNDEFIEALRRYIDSGYVKSIAKEIFDSYGMVVLEFGVVGGYVQIRSTAVSSDLSDYFSSDTDMKSCYETAVSGSAKFGPVSGSFSAEASGCSGEALEFMESVQEQFSSEVEETNYVGGSIVPVVGTERDVFSVTPDTAKLLTNADMYDGDGMRLRLITDFLHPDKINPLEIKRHLLTEAQFDEAQQHLQDHALEILEDIGGFLDDCLPCAGVPYLELQSGTDDFTCNCYEPSLTSPSPTVNPTEAPTGAPSPKATVVKSPWTSWVNEFDETFSAIAKVNNKDGAFCGMRSYHDNHYEDRRFRFKYCTPSDSASKGEETNHVVSDYDGVSTVECSDDSVITKIWSEHSDHYEDRVFSYRCHKFNGWQIDTNTCSWTDYVNDWDETFQFQCEDGKVMTGIESYHDDDHEDRRFTFKCCVWEPL